MRFVAIVVKVKWLLSKTTLFLHFKDQTVTKNKEGLTNRESRPSNIALDHHLRSDNYQNASVFEI